MAATRADRPKIHLPAKAERLIGRRIPAAQKPRPRRDSTNVSLLSQHPLSRIGNRAEKGMVPNMKTRAHPAI
jgi:hypothetical protein